MCALILMVFFVHFFVLVPLTCSLSVKKCSAFNIQECALHAPRDFFFVTEGCGLTVLTAVPRSIHMSDLGAIHTNIVQWSQLKSFTL